MRRQIEIARGPDGVRVRSSIPDLDPDFFSALSSLVGDGGKVARPFASDPWLYTYASRLAELGASVPFALYRDDPRSSPHSRRRELTHACRRHRLRLPPAAVVDRVAHGDDFTLRLAAVRDATPGLPPYALAAAAGAVAIDSRDDPWVGVFRDVNSESTRSQLWEQTHLHYLLGREAYWTLENDKGPLQSDTEIPTQIWCYGSAGWKPEIDEKTARVAKWIFEVGGRRLQYLAHQMLRFHGVNPYSQIRGLGAAEVLSTTITAAVAAQEWNLSFIKNGADPGGTLIVDGTVTPEAKAALLAQHEQAHGGPRNAGRTRLVESEGGLGAGTKYEPNTNTHRAMQFAEQQEWARDTIGAVIGLPKAAAGLVQDANRANMEASLAWVWTGVIIPKLRYFEDLLASDLFTAKRAQRGRRVFGLFDLSGVEALRENLTEKLAQAETLMRLGVPLNDVNARLGLGLRSYPHGATAYVPYGLVPVGELTVLAPAAPTPSAEAQANQAPPKPTAEQTSAPLMVARASLNVPEHWHGLVERVFDPGERGFLGRYRRDFLIPLKTEQQRLLTKDWRKDPESHLFTLGDWQQRLVTATQPAYVRIWNASEEQARADVEAARRGLSASSAITRSFQQTIGLRQDLLRASVATIRDELLKILVALVDQEASDEEAESAIAGAFNNLNRGKAALTARTETGATVSAARDDVFDEAGVEEGEWLTAQDELVRETHRDYGNAGAKPRGSNWAEGRGYVLRYPHDPDAPAHEVIGCRCVLIPK